MEQTHTAPLERKPARLTAKQAAALATARKTAEAVHVLTMAQATEQATTLLGRLVRGALLHQGFYACTLAGVRTLYVRADAS